MFAYITTPKPSPVNSFNENAYCYKRGNKLGFSLVELLIVVAILAILAAIAIPLFLNQRSRAAQGVVISDARNLATDLTTLFAGLPSGAVTFSVGGSFDAGGSISGAGGQLVVNGEVIQGELSPNITVVKTTAPNPTDGAGVKVFHTDSPNYVCTIYIPSTTQNGFSPSFQPQCGKIISEEGNLLTADEAFFASGTLGGWAPHNYNVPGGRVVADVSYSTSPQFKGFGSLQVVPGLESAEAIPPTGRIVKSFNLGPESKKYTAQTILKGNPGQLSILVVYFTQESGGSGASSINSSSTGDWESLELIFTSVQGSGSHMISTGISGPEEPAHIAGVGIWEGEGGVWAPPGVPIVQP